MLTVKLPYPKSKVWTHVLNHLQGYNSVLACNTSATCANVSVGVRCWWVDPTIVAGQLKRHVTRCRRRGLPGKKKKVQWVCTCTQAFDLIHLVTTQTKRSSLLEKAGHSMAVHAFSCFISPFCGCPDTSQCLLDQPDEGWIWQTWDLV
jgi:hypothetical protein